MVSSQIIIQKSKRKIFFDDLYQILQNEFPNNYEVIFSDYKNIIQNINWPQIFQMQNSELSNITEENKAQLQYVLNEIYHLDIPQHEKYMILNIVTQYANEDLKLLKIKKIYRRKNLMNKYIISLKISMIYLIKVHI